MINIFSYIFSILLIATSILLILSRNPVHCIFYFIFCIFNLSGLFLLIHVEYLAVIFLLVYVGAIAVLFLFVVMMLNIKIMDTYELRIRYIPLGLFICFLLFIELYLLILVNIPTSNASNIYYIN
jgi:NADH-quinone oxidoreductase subunit J